MAHSVKSLKVRIIADPTARSPINPSYINKEGIVLDHRPDNSGLHTFDIELEDGSIALNVPLVNLKSL